MKKIILLVALTILAPQFLSAQHVVDNKSITGSWIGKIQAGGISLRIIFNLSHIEKDSLVATLDSPDQGAKNIKIGPASFNGTDLNIKAPLLLGEYKGTMKNDTLIEGTWSQAGRSTDLSLTRLKVLFTLNRPQDPKPPLPYTSEEVEFINDKFNITLSGTLTIPKGEGPYPAVILVTGSGPQNRNEELLGHRPFLIIADYFSSNGIAVLRYDDRGVGKSQGNYATATTVDLATDAEAAYTFLKRSPKINSGLIGLAGHSEGGLISPIVASLNPGIAFVVSIAGPGVKGEAILHKQNYDITKASGKDDKEIKKGIAINRKLFEIVRKEPDNNKAIDKMTVFFKKELEKDTSSTEAKEITLKQFQGSIGSITNPWFRYFLVADPAVYWKKVKCPVLAINGEKDLQVNYEINLPAIEKVLKSGGNMSVTTKSFPGLNHLFQHSKTGLPSEYGEIEETFSPEVLKFMGDWILGLK